MFSGKAHPMDEPGKGFIRDIFAIAKTLGSEIKIAYVPNYEMEVARLLVAGVDLWLNTPNKPLEASGTSGMKAAHNGVPSLSVLDGWWIEGHIEGVTGWSVGSPTTASEGDDVEAAELYDKLEKAIVSCYYSDPSRWASVMQQSIAFNASFFNTQRMVQEYVLSAYY